MQKYVDTRLGRIYRTQLKGPISNQYRRLTIYEGYEVKNQILKILDHWSIVAFQTGKIDGPGYGCQISASYGSECGQMFIIKKSNHSFADADAQLSFNQELSKYSNANTPMGMVLKIGINNQIPYGFRKMQRQQGFQVKEYIEVLVSPAQNIAFSNGKISRNQDGCIIEQQAGYDCESILVISMAQM